MTRKKKSAAIATWIRKEIGHGRPVYTQDLTIRGSKSNRATIDNVRRVLAALRRVGIVESGSEGGVGWTMLVSERPSFSSFGKRRIPLPRGGEAVPASAVWPFVPVWLLPTIAEILDAYDVVDCEPAVGRRPAMVRRRK